MPEQLLMLPHVTGVDVAAGLGCSPHARARMCAGANLTGLELNLIMGDIKANRAAAEKCLEALTGLRLRLQLLTPVSRQLVPPLCPCRTRAVNRLCAGVQERVQRASMRCLPVALHCHGATRQQCVCALVPSRACIRVWPCVGCGGRAARATATISNCERIVKTTVPQVPPPYANAPPPPSRPHPYALHSPLAG